MMSGVALKLEHTVNADVSPAFAWAYLTDIANWNDPPAKFALEGPFQVGTRGTTLIPGQEPLHWCIEELQPGEYYSIEMGLDRAQLRIQWHFKALSPDKTTLTQQVSLLGDNAAAYAEQVQTGFSANLASGMQRVAAEMTAAERRLRHSR